MLHIARLREIERELGFTYPSSFVDRFEEFSAISENEHFSDFMPHAQILSSVADIRLAYQNDLPNRYIPFLLEGQPAHVDYYVFDTSTTPPEFQVSIFAVHTLVHNWSNFESFLAWLKARTHA